MGLNVSITHCTPCFRLVVHYKYITLIRIQLLKDSINVYLKNQYL